MLTLETAQRAAADTAFEHFDFGTDVVAVNGWECTLPGTEMTRTVFLQGPHSGEPSERAHFTVRFQPESSQIVEAYAINAHGEHFGQLG